MEDVLDLYNAPYDPAYPVVCYDERPCFLIGDRIKPIEVKKGQPKKEHYAYTKHGSCNLLAAIEPLTGRRLGRVYERRRGLEYTRFCQELAEIYPKATKIRLVQDNLNTHKKGSFYKHLPVAEARALAQRFEFYFTPKSASWLNMIECEFSALSRLCLKRRIPSIEQLRTEVLTILKERDAAGIKISWQFTIPDARRKMQRHYHRVNPANKNIR